MSDVIWTAEDGQGVVFVCVGCGWTSLEIALPPVGEVFCQDPLCGAWGFNFDIVGLEGPPTPPAEGWNDILQL